MDFIEPALFILFFAILAVPIASRFRLPLEVFLVVGSCLISLIPGLPRFQINPIIVFYLFLPPILFYAAYFTSWRDFKFNIRAISLLAIGLVIFTAIVVACIVKLILPGFSWQEALLLGAIISPTDASSATTIIKKLGAPRRIVTILEGESLFNDASALLLFRFSLAAVMSGNFSMPHAVAQFFVVTFGGIFVGIFIAVLSFAILKKLNDAQAETTLTFITAFTCYVVAESIGVSGVIATVVGGIYAGLNFPVMVSSQTRINAKASWNTLLFIINCFVFTLIGLQLPQVTKGLMEYPVSTLIIYGFALSLFVILLRVMWIYPAAYLSSKLFPAIARKDPTPNWKILFILSWSGMRGIVSLAAALSLPLFLSSGMPFPHRDIMIFITYSVIFFTLFIPSISTPSLLKLLRLVDSEDKIKEEALARLLTLQAALDRIEELVRIEKIPEDIFNEFKNQIHRRLTVIKTQLQDTPYSTLTDEYQALKKLTISTLESERETLIKLRKEGKIHDEIFHLISDELDLEEMRAKSLRI